MATATTTAAPQEAEAVEEYENDPEEVKRSLVMRRREANEDEEESEEKGSRGRMDRRLTIHSDDESDGQGGAPSEYDAEEHDGELEDGEEDEEEEEEAYEEEDGKADGNDGEVRVKVAEGNDVRRNTRGAVEVSPGNNDNDNENNDDVEGKKESTEPFAVPTAGTFYMHDDRFRSNVGGRHRY